MRPLDLKSNALTTRPSWCRYRDGSQPFLHPRPRSLPPPGPFATLGGAPSPRRRRRRALPPLFPARRARSARGGARGRPLLAAGSGRAGPAGSAAAGRDRHRHRDGPSLARRRRLPAAGPVAEGGGGGGSHSRCCFPAEKMDVLHGTELRHF
ncbi:laforin-like [Poecile atricapillus]|uniref:laforin-like n=1 Tax=Poecile atricapillus TaxID=48891 RepID=UPI00273A1ED8|nr:laforin-like [Poecile atricapillus]